MARRIADRPATPSERSRASRLRRKASLSSRDRAWLDRYTIARGAYAEKSKRERAPRPLSCRAQAVLFVQRFLDAIETEAEIESEWLIKYRKAHAHAEWSSAFGAIAFDDIPDFDFPGDNPLDRIMNIRVKVVNVTVVKTVAKGKTIMASSGGGEWISLVSLTDAWHNLDADVARSIEHLPERPSLRFQDDSQVEIAGVSVLVSDKRKE